jgi:integrase
VFRGSDRNKPEKFTYLSNNAGQKPKAKPNQGRNRWTASELKKLIRSTAFTDSTTDFKWVTLIMLYGGLRPSEAYQLKPSDIQFIDGVYCINVNDSATGQRIKNINAKRYVPIHKTLIEQGFMIFLA